jgi:ABC-type antimicrobial peptide transport system permease subunit
MTIKAFMVDARKAVVAGTAAVAAGVAEGLVSGTVAHTIVGVLAVASAMLGVYFTTNGSDSTGTSNLVDGASAAK